MAIFRLSVGIISRGTGGSAVASAAYRHAAVMRSEQDARTLNHSVKAGELVHSEIALPDGAPAWAETAFGTSAFEAAALEMSPDGNGPDGGTADAYAKVMDVLDDATGTGPHWAREHFGPNALEATLTATGEDVSGSVSAEAVRAGLGRLLERAPDWAARTPHARAIEMEIDRLPAPPPPGGDGTAVAGDAVERAVWAKLSERLWNGVQDRERAVNTKFRTAQLARSLTIALPGELGRGSQIGLMRDFVAEAFTGRGMVADWVIHDKGDGNPHAHVMLTLRGLGDDGWGAKVRAWNSRSLLQEWREAWAAHVNVALAREGFVERVDHRSNRDRGLLLEPESHNPYIAAHARAGDGEARESDRTAEVRERNQRFLADSPEHILIVVQSQKAVFTEADVRGALEVRLGGSLERDRILELGDRAMAHPELIELERTTPDGAPQYVTAARAAAEQSLAAAARDLAGSVLDLDPALPGAGALSGNLNAGQRAAAAAMLSPSRLTMVQGHAGVGKTFAVAEAARVWRARGFEVMGTALAGKAVQELGGVRGMKAATLAAWEARWARGDLPPPGRFVVFMDEAGMVGAAQWLRIQDRIAELGGKLVAVGDPEQLQPVAEIAGWHPAERGAGPSVTVSQVVRQEGTGDRIASGRLAEGGPEAGLAIGHYARQGALRLDGRVLSDPVAALAAEYFEGGGVDESRIAMGYSNRDVWALNDRIRAEALRRGVIDRDTVRSYGSVDRIDRSGTAPRRTPVALDLGVGDRIMLTRPHRELELPRSAFGTVTSTREGSIDVSMDGMERTVTIDLSEFRDLDRGFAATVHKAQGLTVDHALVLGHARLHRHAVYVALTRHRRSVRVFGRRRHLETEGDLRRLASVPGHLSTGLPDVPDRAWPSSGTAAESVGVGARLDWMGDDTARRPSGVLGDTALIGAAERYAGLLSAGWSEGDPPVGDDPRDYALEPQRIVDDLLERQSVLRADEVADRLARVVAEPETFLRLFLRAMAHPDLLVLSETGLHGEGRVYTGRDQIATDLEAVDRGVRLALGGAPYGQPDGAAPLTPDERARLGEAQSMAFDHAVSPGRLRLVRGDSGTGKTRVSAAVLDAYGRAGWQAVGLAPTGAGLDSLRDAGIADPWSVRAFLNRAEAGHVRLDRRTVIVLDDAGRLAGKQAGRLLEMVEESGARLVAMVDGGMQAPPAAGPVFRALEVRLGAARLDEVFGRAPERALALSDLARGGVAAEGALAALEAEGVIVSGTTPRKAVEVLAEAYVRDGSRDRVALAWSRAEVAALTSAIRRRLDHEREDRRSWVDGTEGLFQDLRPGDRIRFLTANGRLGGAGRTEQGSPFVRAGEEAVLVGRTDGGALLMEIGVGASAREVVWRPGDRVPEWRFSFAGTIHGELGRRPESVHLLASPGMNRQLLVSAMNLHGTDLNVVVPAAEGRKLEVLSRILRRDASARSALDYGFAPALAGREALRGYVTAVDHPAAGRVAAAVERLRSMAGLSSVEIPDAPPRGLEGEVLGEVIGAAILRDGAAPSGADRLGVERYVHSLSDRGDWRSMLAGAPGDLPAQADALAMEAAGTDSSGRLMTTARILARGALLARAAGEERVADLFDAGLALYGQRAQIARMLGKVDDLVAPKARGAGQGRGMDGLPFGSGERRRRRGRRPMRRGLDIGGILASVEGSDEQVARDALGMFGIGGAARRRRRVAGYAAERGAAAAWRGRAQALGAKGRERAGDGPAPAGGSGVAVSRSYDAMTEGHCRELALPLACAVTRRADADSPVHGPGLQDAIHALLKDAVRERSGREADITALARTIARARAEADLRVSISQEIQESSLAAETARFRGEPVYADPALVDEWRDRHGKAARRLAGREVVPTPLERLVAAAVVTAEGDGPERTAEAMAAALGKGRPEMDVLTLRRERDVLSATLGSPEPGMERAVLAEQLYGAFTASEIRAMATAGRDGEVPDVLRGADAGTVALNVRSLHEVVPAADAPWVALHRSIGRSVGVAPGRDRTVGVGVGG